MAIFLTLLACIAFLLCWNTVPSTSFQNLDVQTFERRRVSSITSIVRGKDAGSSLFQFSRSKCNKCRLSRSFTMLRRQDREVEETDFSEQSKSTTLERGDKDPTQKEISDFSGWRISSKKKLPGICDLADEIQNWMLRVELTARKDGGLDDAGLAIVAEFENSKPKEAKQVRVGGAAGEMKNEEIESWFKEKGSYGDYDPTGVLRRAEAHLKEAEQLNMTYIDFVKKYVKKPVLPTVEVVRPHRRVLAEDVLQLVTAPHSYPVHTQLPRVPYSSCWYGLFFEVEALDQDIEITALYTQSGIYHSERRDLVNVTVYTREGGAAGFELDRTAWDLAGQADNARLVRVNFKTNTDPQFGRLPLDAPLRVRAGSRRGFLVHTTQARGIAVRARLQGVWEAGDITDSDPHVTVRAGLLPCGDDLYEHKMDGGRSLPTSVFQEVYSPLYGGAFVGIIDYRLV